MLLPGSAQLPNAGAGWRRGTWGMPRHERTGQHQEGSNDSNHDVTHSRCLSAQQVLWFKSKLGSSIGSWKTQFYFICEKFLQLSWSDELQLIYWWFCDDLRPYCSRTQHCAERQNSPMVSPSSSPVSQHRKAHGGEAGHCMQHLSLPPVPPRLDLIQKGAIRSPSASPTGSPKVSVSSARNIKANVPACVKDKLDSQVVTSW